MKGTQELQADIFSAIGGRDDVYALQHLKGQYFPVKRPLTLEIYQDPSKTVGVYPIDKTGFVKMGIFDIDILKKYLGDDRKELDELARKQAQLLRAELHSIGISSKLEFSGSKGYHVWIFLEERVSAVDMYALLTTIKQDVGIIDHRLDVELFPKQDSVKEGGFGNLIKLPFQLHKVSKKQCYFVDNNFEPHFPETLPLNSPDLIPQAPEKELQTGTVNFAQVPGPSVQPYNLKLMLSKCRVLNEMQRINDSKYFEGKPGHNKRLFLASVMTPFGPAGRDKVHEILSQAEDYKVGKTNTQLDSIKGPPQTCEYICGKQKCANICMAGGKSPIKFGYMEDIVTFMEKQTSSYAYLDRRDGKIYFVESEKKLSIILDDAGQVPKKIIVLKIIFDPSQDQTIDMDKKTINLFRPTDFMVMEKTSRVIDLETEIPNTYKLLTNLLPVASEKERYLNWNAGIIQTREKQLTAWVFMGAQGAGKNLLLDYILRVLFGKDQAVKVEDWMLKSEFNGWMQNALVIAFNEVAHDNRSRNQMNNKIKPIITDPDVGINEKNVKVFTIDNHVNAVFFSNEQIPVLIENGDRRYNVVQTGGNLRKNSWFSDPKKFLKDLEAEAPLFAEYLMNFDYDSNLAETVINNSKKQSLVQAGMNRFEDFANHLKENDVEWFKENMDQFTVSLRFDDLILDGEIDKDTALSLFKEINGEKISTKKLTTELALYEVKKGRGKRDAEGKRAPVYKW